MRLNDERAATTIGFFHRACGINRRADLGPDGSAWSVAVRWDLAHDRIQRLGQQDRVGDLAAGDHKCQRAALPIGHQVRLGREPAARTTDRMVRRLRAGRGGLRDVGALVLCDRAAAGGGAVWLPVWCRLIHSYHGRERRP